MRWLSLSMAAGLGCGPTAGTAPPDGCPRTNFLSPAWEQAEATRCRESARAQAEQDAYSASLAEESRGAAEAHEAKLAEERRRVDDETARQSAARRELVARASPIDPAWVGAYAGAIVATDRRGECVVVVQRRVSLAIDAYGFAEWQAYTANADSCAPAGAVSPGCWKVGHEVRVQPAGETAALRTTRAAAVPAPVGSSSSVWECFGSRVELPLTWEPDTDQLRKACVRLGSTASRADERSAEAFCTVVPLFNDLDRATLTRTDRGVRLSIGDHDVELVRESDRSPRIDAGACRLFPELPLCGGRIEDAPVCDMAYDPSLYVRGDANVERADARAKYEACRSRQYDYASLLDRTTAP